MRSYSDQSALSEWSGYERTGKAWERGYMYIYGCMCMSLSPFDGGKTTESTDVHVSCLRLFNPFLQQVAKWVGDIFNEGLYDIHVEVKQTPLLGWESPHRMEK